jgi:hypothetical protein
MNGYASQFIKWDLGGGEGIPVSAGSSASYVLEHFFKAILVRFETKLLNCQTN